jgi:hypothetical protein
VRTICPEGWEAAAGGVGTGVERPGVALEIKTCSVPAKFGVAIEEAVTIRKNPGPKIAANNKKPQTKISPAAR